VFGDLLWDLAHGAHDGTGGRNRPDTVLAVMLRDC